MQIKQKATVVQICLSFLLFLASLFAMYFVLLGGDLYAQGAAQETIPESTNGGSLSQPRTPSGAVDNVPLEQNPIFEWMVYFINVATFGVLVLLVGSIVVGGIQYSVSQGNPQKTAAARDRIISALIGLALFSLMAVILQWLIPGGIFS